MTISRCYFLLSNRARLTVSFPYSNLNARLFWKCIFCSFSISSCLDVTSHGDERGGITRCTRWRNILEIFHSTALWPLNRKLFFSVESIPLGLAEREHIERLNWSLLPLYISVYIDHDERKKEYRIVMLLQKRITKPIIWQNANIRHVVLHF